jgi:hypothetical protein
MASLIDTYERLCYLQSAYNLVITTVPTVHMSAHDRDTAEQVAAARNDDIMTAINDCYDQLVPPTQRNTTCHHCDETPCCADLDHCDRCDSRDRRGEDE